MDRLPSKIEQHFLSRVEKSIEINASPKKVWPLMAWERLPEWYDPIKKVEWTSKEKNKVGAPIQMPASYLSISVLACTRDYSTKYPAAAEIDTSGIGNTAYFVDTDNLDPRPILKP